MFSTSDYSTLFFAFWLLLRGWKFPSLGFLLQFSRLLWRIPLKSEGQPCCPWSHGLRPTNFQLVWWCHQLLSGFLAKGHLPRVSCQSRRSLVIRVTITWSWGLCTDLLAFVYSWGKPQKTLARRPSEEGAMWPVIVSNGVPFFSKWGR